VQYPDTFIIPKNKTLTMKTKTFLVLAGLATTQCMFNSCGEDNSNLQNENSSLGTSKIITELPSSFVSTQNYFLTPEPYNSAVNFMRSHIAAQGASYSLTQADLNLFYDKAQISANERLPLDRVNQIIAQTLEAIHTQKPLNQIVQQLNISDNAKSLLLSIDGSSISDLENNLQFINLPSQEKVCVRNFNNFQRNYEQGAYQIGSTLSKEAGWEKGAKIGFMFGGFIGGVLGPVGFVGGLCAGSLIGAVIGSFSDK
jgi:hypothetical protein